MSEPIAVDRTLAKPKTVPPPRGVPVVHCRRTTAFGRLVPTESQPLKLSRDEFRDRKGDQDQRAAHSSAGTSIKWRSSDPIPMQFVNDPLPLLYHLKADLGRHLLAISPTPKIVVEKDGKPMDYEFRVPRSPGHPPKAPGRSAALVRPSPLPNDRERCHIQISLLEWLPVPSKIS